MRNRQCMAQNGRFSGQTVVKWCTRRENKMDALVRLKKIISWGETYGALPIVVTHDVFFKEAYRTRSGPQKITPLGKAIMSPSDQVLFQYPMQRCSHLVGILPCEVPLPPKKTKSVPKIAPYSKPGESTPLVQFFTHL